MNKPTYRATIFFTEDKYKGTPPSNIFLYADNEERAKLRAGEIFQDSLRANGLTKAQFKVEVRLSSDAEVREYIAARTAGHTTTGAVN